LAAVRAVGAARSASTATPTLRASDQDGRIQVAVQLTFEARHD